MNVTLTATPNPVAPNEVVTFNGSTSIPVATAIPIVNGNAETGDTTGWNTLNTNVASGFTTQ